jgi:hypothetical protein
MLKTLLLMVAGSRAGPRDRGGIIYCNREKLASLFYPFLVTMGKKTKEGRERMVNLNYVTVSL